MAEPTFLVTYPIPEPGMGSLRAAGRVHVPEEQPTPEELRDACASGDFDVVVAQLSDRFDADLLGAAKLAGISNYAVGYDNIDIPAATANGIPVGNTPGVLTDATADLAMLLILATARRAVEADQFTRSGQFTGWKPELLLGQDVSGATLGLAGFGRIARATAQRATAFGMDVTFCSHPPDGRTVDDAELARLPYPVRQVGWPELVERSDFLSVHVPLAPSTKHLIDASTIAAMKPTAILVNTARGPIVDEAALVTSLRQRPPRRRRTRRVRRRAPPRGRPRRPAERRPAAAPRECDDEGARPDGRTVRGQRRRHRDADMIPPHCVNPEAAKPR